MSDQPTVFHLITRLLNGGAEGETLKLVQGVEDYSAILGYGSDALPERVREFRDAGAETHQFGLMMHYNPITAPLAVASVATFLRGRDVDIVHTHSTEAGIIGRFAAAMVDGPKVVHTVHGVPFSEDRNRLLNRFVLSAERFTARYSDRILTNTDRIRDDYLRRGIGVREQYRTIHSGIDIEQFSEADPANDIDADIVRVVMVARLAEGKGFDVLLDAAEELREMVHVYIAGDGPLEERIETEIEDRGLGDAVSLLGFRRDIPAVLAASDILVLPSYREGMPRVVTEAMATGLPVVATNIAGIPDQVVDGETGYLIPTGDARALAERVRRLATRPDLRKRMGEAGHRRASENFSATEMVDRTQSVYKELLEEQS
jgi:glycosyltransferase involved in cell wall biosynthesis